MRSHSSMSLARKLYSSCRARAAPVFGAKAESLRWREDVGLSAETPVGMFRRMLGNTPGWRTTHALEIHDGMSGLAASQGGFSVAWLSSSASEAARHGSNLGPSTPDDWEERQDRLLDYIAGAKAAAHACGPMGTAVVADVSEFYPFGPAPDPLAKIRVPSTSLRLADSGLAGAVFNAAVHPEYIREARSELGDDTDFCLLAKLPDPSLVDDVHLAAASHADALVLDLTEGGPPSEALVQFTRDWQTKGFGVASPIVVVRRGMGRYADLTGLEGVVLEVHTGDLLRAACVGLEAAARDAYDAAVYPSFVEGGKRVGKHSRRHRATARYETSVVEGWKSLLPPG